MAWVREGQGEYGLEMSAVLIHRPLTTSRTAGQRRQMMGADAMEAAKDSSL